MNTYITIQQGNSVLIHCSDGWDRSSQLTSLTQILMDPYYRTLEGFCVLIEKEWLSYGHQFGYRNGFYTKDTSEDQRAPIFLQWLDCIHQLIVQFPNMFEFSMELLLFIAHHLTSCKYGTFIFNSELERSEVKAKTKTVSIWTDILDTKNEEFINPYYNHNDKNNCKILSPNFAIYKLRFWEEYFLKYLNFNHNLGKWNYVDKHMNLKVKKVKNNLQYIELEKRSDVQTMKVQKIEIEKLNGIIEEISSKLKVAEFNKLSQEAKDYIFKKWEISEEEDYIVIYKKHK